jgi:hypothetical protein
MGQPHCGDPLDDSINTCTHYLMLCTEILCGLDNEWAHVVDIASDGLKFPCNKAW